MSDFNLALVDGSGFIYRAYHALPPFTRQRDNMPVGALYGFSTMLFDLVSRHVQEFEATHLAVVFDAPGRTFRHDIYSAYKSNRPERPADLTAQLDLMRVATRAFGVSAVEMVGFEADDLVATYARLAVEAGGMCTIVSSDKDLMQLVRPGVQMFDPMKKRLLGREDVIEKFGVPPEKVVEVQALAGDSVDNVPGVPGIGVKTGADLVNQFGDLEGILSNLDQIPQKKRRASLFEYRELARISRVLVALSDYVPVETEIDTMAIREPDPIELEAFLDDMEFVSLAERIASEAA